MAFVSSSMPWKVTVHWHIWFSRWIPSATRVCNGLSNFWFKHKHCTIWHWVTLIWQIRVWQRSPMFSEWTVRLSVVSTFVRIRPSPMPRSILFSRWSIGIKRCLLVVWIIVVSRRMGKRSCAKPNRSNGNWEDRTIINSTFLCSLFDHICVRSSTTLTSAIPYVIFSRRDRIDCRRRIIAYGHTQLHRSDMDRSRKESMTFPKQQQSPDVHADPNEFQLRLTAENRFLPQTTTSCGFRSLSLSLCWSRSVKVI